MNRKKDSLNKSFKSQANGKNTEFSTIKRRAIEKKVTVTRRVISTSCTTWNYRYVGLTILIWSLACDSCKTNPNEAVYDGFQEENPAIDQARLCMWLVSGLFC